MSDPQTLAARGEREHCLVGTAGAVLSVLLAQAFADSVTGVPR
jgi:hypothetical protein